MSASKDCNIPPPTVKKQRILKEIAAKANPLLGGKDAEALYLDETVYQ